MLALRVGFTLVRFEELGGEMRKVGRPKHCFLLAVAPLFLSLQPFSVHYFYLCRLKGFLLQ